MKHREFLEILARLERLGFICEHTDSDDLETIARALLDKVEAEALEIRFALMEALHEHIEEGGTKEITIILCKLIALLA